MEYQVDLGDIVAVVALLVSAYSIKKTIDFNKRQNEFSETAAKLNSALLEREILETQNRKRADLSANFVKTGRTNYRLKIFNRGSAAATNVRIELPEDQDLLIDSDVEGKFPAPILEPQQNIDLIAAVHMGSPSRITIKLIWDDELGENNEKTLTPTI